MFGDNTGQNSVLYCGPVTFSSEINPDIRCLLQLITQEDAMGLKWGDFGDTRRVGGMETQCPFVYESPNKFETEITTQTTASHVITAIDNNKLILISIKY